MALASKRRPSDTVPPRTAEIEDILKRGDRVDFRAFLRGCTKGEALNAMAMAGRLRMPDMADLAYARFHGPWPSGRGRRPAGPSSP